MNYASFFASIAIVSIALLAHDYGRRWLKERAAARSANDELVRLAARIDTQLEMHRERDAIVKKLAEDWKQKFVQLERDWEVIRANASGQFAGTLAQLESQQRKGFGR